MAEQQNEPSVDEGITHQGQQKNWSVQFGDFIPENDIIQKVTLEVTIYGKI